MIISYIVVISSLVGVFQVYPDDSSSYPLRLKSNHSVRVVSGVKYIPQTNLLDNQIGLLLINREDNKFNELVQYNSEENIIGHHFRISEFDYASTVSIDFNKDGIDDLLVFKFDDNDSSRIYVAIYERNKSVSIIDTLTVPKEFIKNGRRFEIDSRYNSVVGDTNTIYTVYVGKSVYYEYRYLSIYTRGTHPLLRKRFRSPVSLESISVVQTGPDSGDAIITGAAYCNGVYGYQLKNHLFPDSLNDCQSYVMRITNTGEIRWIALLDEGCGRTRVTTDATGDTVFALFSRSHLSYESRTAHLYRIRGTDGSVIDHRQYEGYMEIAPSLTMDINQCGLLFVRKDGSSETLVRLSQTGDVLREYKLPTELQSPSLMTWIHLPNGHLGIALMTDGPSIVILDSETGRFVARQPLNEVFYIQAVRMGEAGGRFHDQLFAQSTNSFMLMSIKQNRFPFWLIRRYKWLLLAFLIPPALLLAAFSGLRYYHIRRTSRRNLEEYNEQLRQLSESMRDAQEDERKHVAHEIHDRLGQVVAALRWELERAEELGSAHRRDLEKHVEELQSKIREISSDLRPPLFEDMGLIAAIEWELDRFQKRFGISAVLVCESPEVIQDVRLQVELFRSIQEGLTNILKHANATEVEIHYQNTDNLIEILVIDNGDGVLEDDASVLKGKTLGILNIRERLQRYNGNVCLVSENGKTVLKLVIPMIQS